jgi:hypothetical protein
MARRIAKASNTAGKVPGGTAGSWTGALEGVEDMAKEVGSTATAGGPRFNASRGADRRRPPRRGPRCR